MIVEPVPTSSRSRRRRALGLVAILVPIALFAVVVGVGVLGRTSTPEKGLIAANEEAQTSADPGAPEAPSAATSPEPTPRPRRPPFPVGIAGLPVLSIPTLLATLTDTTPDRVLAVAGYLGITDPPTDCGDGMDPLGPLCERMALFAESPWTLRGSEGFTGLGPHLHPRVPVGVHLPPQIADTTTEAGGSPFAAVIVGHLRGTPDGNCGPVLANCEVDFDLDAVVWVSGSPYDVYPFMGPGIDVAQQDWVLSNRPEAEARAVGPAGLVLSTALLRPATLRTIDPAAARMVRRDNPRGLVWYIRGVSRSLYRGATETFVWAVIDDTDLRILAKGVGTGAGAGAP